jgi:hypothetical protein
MEYQDSRGTRQYIPESAAQLCDNIYCRVYNVNEYQKHKDNNVFGE